MEEMLKAIIEAVIAFIIGAGFLFWIVYKVNKEMKNEKK